MLVEEGKIWIVLKLYLSPSPPCPQGSAKEICGVISSPFTDVSFYLLNCSLDPLATLPQAHILYLLRAMWEGQPCACKPLTFCFVISILMEDVEALIQQQTSNDTVSPRASTSYYEQYHSLNEVSHHVPERSRFHLTSIAISAIIQES